jgi:hypothetical protein
MSLNTVMNIQDNIITSTNNICIFADNSIFLQANHNRDPLAEVQQGGHVIISAGEGTSNREKRLGGSAGYITLRGGNGTYSHISVEIDNLILANPIKVICNNHRLSTPDKIKISAITTTVELNDKSFYVKVIDDNTFELFYDIELTDSVDGANYRPYLQDALTIVVNNIHDHLTGASIIISAVDFPNIKQVTAAGDWYMTGPGVVNEKIKGVVNLTEDTVQFIVDPFCEFQNAEYILTRLPKGSGRFDHGQAGGDVMLTPGDAFNREYGERGKLILDGLKWPRELGKHKQLLTNNDTGQLTWEYLFIDSVPTSPSDTGSPGQMSYDDNFFYICVATNTWRRISLDTQWK